jgi:hypothetical protein
MNALQKLKKIAKSREQAYRISGHMDGGKMAAITHIKRVAGYFSTKSEQVQLRAVNQIQKEVLLILPDERSRFAKMREEALSILLKAAQA